MAALVGIQTDPIPQAPDLVEVIKCDLCPFSYELKSHDQSSLTAMKDHLTEQCHYAASMYMARHLIKDGVSAFEITGLKQPLKIPNEKAHLETPLVICPKCLVPFENIPQCACHYKHFHDQNEARYALTQVLQIEELSAKNLSKRVDESSVLIVCMGVGCDKKFTDCNSARVHLESSHGLRESNESDAQAKVMKYSTKSLKSNLLSITDTNNLAKDIELLNSIIQLDETFQGAHSDAKKVRALVKGLQRKLKNSTKGSSSECYACEKVSVSRYRSCDESDDDADTDTSKGPSDKKQTTEKEAEADITAPEAVVDQKVVDTKEDIPVVAKVIKPKVIKNRLVVVIKCDFCEFCYDLESTDTSLMKDHLDSELHYSASQFYAHPLENENSFDLSEIIEPIKLLSHEAYMQTHVVVCHECKQTFDDVVECAMHCKFLHRSPTFTYSTAIVYDVTAMKEDALTNLECECGEVCEYPTEILNHREENSHFPFKSYDENNEKLNVLLFCGTENCAEKFTTFESARRHVLDAHVGRHWPNSVNSTSALNAVLYYSSINATYELPNLLQKTIDMARDLMKNVRKEVTPKKVKFLQQTTTRSSNSPRARTLSNKTYAMKCDICPYSCLLEDEDLTEISDHLEEAKHSSARRYFARRSGQKSMQLTELANEQSVIMKGLNRYPKYKMLTDNCFLCPQCYTMFPSMKMCIYHFRYFHDNKMAVYSVAPVNDAMFITCKTLSKTLCECGEEWDTIQRLSYHRDKEHHYPFQTENSGLKLSVVFHCEAEHCSLIFNKYTSACDHFLKKHMNHKWPEKRQEEPSLYMITYFGEESSTILHDTFRIPYGRVKLNAYYKRKEERELKNLLRYLMDFQGNGNSNRALQMMRAIRKGQFTYLLPPDFYEAPCIL